jgi:multidrug resistance efflux pump
LLLAGLALCAALGGCALRPTGDAPALTASGFIEGEVVTLAAETDGRVAQILASRGDRVTAGQVLVRLDDAALQSQRREVEAALAAAEANLAQVRAGVRDAQIDAARADLARARAQSRGARDALVAAREALANPQALDARIHEAQGQVRLSEQGVEMAEANLAETRLKRGVYAGKGGDVARAWNLQEHASTAALRQAEAELAGARSALDALRRIRERPLELIARLHEAESQVALSAAQVEAAEARLAELSAGPTQEAVAVAETEVRQARSALLLVDARIDQLTLAAPLDGVVTARSAQVGEAATPGQPLLNVANLDEVTLAVYIPVPQIGAVSVGQPVSVTVDSFPDRAFIGRVTRIASTAEFTPRDVQTEEERANLVFAVDITISNPDHALKLGMPADASFVK